MAAISEHSIKRGEVAEAAFADWLDQSRMSYLRPNQTPDSMPQNDGLRIKRPDFLVGVPALGSITIEVKCKKIQEKQFRIDWGEVVGLQKFSHAFRLPLFIVNLEPNATLLWFRLEQFYNLPNCEMRGKKTVAIQVQKGIETPIKSNFYSIVGEIFKLPSATPPT